MRMDANSLTPAEALKQYWGFDSFRPLQQEAIDSVVSGRDSVVVLPTGGGKSICFQVPAICLPGMAIVVSPLISLMKDQVDALRSNGVPAACVNSMLSYQERMRVADEIRGGRIKLLYAAPERLLMDRTIEFLQEISVSFIAIDEAHCVSEWGHDFRPDYRGLRALKTAFPEIGIHAYTATATEIVREDIATQLGLNEPDTFVGSFDRPNLVYKVKPRNNGLSQIREVLDRYQNESGIIYCISRKKVDETSETLNELGYRTLPYHAGMQADRRQRNQEAFINERCDVIVATVAFGMGIDKSNVRYVIHAEMPKSLEAYQQESGRAGRDGLEAECNLFYSGGDYNTWTRLLGKTSDVKARDAALDSLGVVYDFCTGITCRHRTIVRHFGQDIEGESCNACDICLGELELIDDALVVGQKILSCVVRIDQRFGGEYTAQVLKGSKDQRIISNGHDELSTWGLLAEETQRTIRDWIEQLASQGFLERYGEYNQLQVTNAGWELLRGEGTPRLTKPRAAGKKSKSKVAAESWEGVDRELFEILRGLRREIAEEKQVPAYVVFGDATLREMARLRPTSQEGFLEVRGVGEKKCSDYGETFLEAISDYCSTNQIATDLKPGQTESDTQPAEVEQDDGPKRPAIPSFPHFRAGLSVEQVAAEMDRAVSTVSGYLSEYIHHEKVSDPSPWVAAETVQQIEEATRHVDIERLKPIYEHLDGAVSYEDIRIVVACLKNRFADQVEEEGPS